MTSNGGYQLPQMASSGQDLANMVESVADAIDRHMEAIFVSVRSTLESSQWVPDAIKPPQRPTPTPIPLSVLQRGQKWADENRAITAAICAFVGTGAFLAWRRRRMSRLRRKARKGSQGNRTEAVVLAGSPHSLLTRSLAQDLEKRGFIVFVVTDTLADEQVVRGEGKTDIHPLNLDLSSPDAASDSLSKFAEALNAPKRSQPAHLASLILLPHYDSHIVLPISALEKSQWSNTLAKHVLDPISLVHAFLPLLQAQLSMPTRTNPPSPTPATTIVCLSPAITPSLPLPSHAPEAVSAAAITAYLRTLKAEVPPSLSISHIQIGAIDMSGAPGAGEQLQQMVLHPRSRSGSPSSNSSTDLAPERRRPKPKLNGTPLRGLHHAVFDAVVGKSSGTVFVGRGARAYTIAGEYLPVSLVRWMVGGGQNSAEESRLIRRGSEDWEKVDEQVEV